MSYLFDGMPSLASILRGAALFGIQIPFQVNQPSGAAPRLGLARECQNPGTSCQNKEYALADTCCVNYPGGQFAQTQFWNSDPHAGSDPNYIGPNNSWTIHGLWPDHCDGSFDSVCDCERSGDCSRQNWKCDACNRNYSSITQILKNFGQDDLLSYMDSMWKGINGNEHLWQHEWSKHGSCCSTLHPKCYSDYQSTQEVIHYFQRSVDVFKTLPTFDWLAAADIVPSNDKTYNLADIKEALKAPRGVSPVIGCQGNQLREVWYHFVIRGSLQSGEFVEVEPDFSGTGGPGKSCPASGIRYLPKQVPGSPTSTANTQPTATSGPSGKGHIVVKLKSGGERGCLISNGKWYNTIIGSSCATFTSSGSKDTITLRTRKGPCGIENGGLVCGLGTSSTPFKVDGALLLGQNGEKVWSADSIPRGTDQETVHLSGHKFELELEWRA